MNAAELIAFEADIAAAFNRGEIRAPVHLSGGNERQLIEIFKDIRSEDWVCGSWRMHYHCLLKGVPPAELKAEIMAGRSMTLCFPKNRIISSAIVGGILPIALGIAWHVKRAGGKELVWAFAGDMTIEGGVAHECVQYAAGFGLPIIWVVEDNGVSVCTDTKQAWGLSYSHHDYGHTAHLGIKYYRYELSWPHAGSGKRIQF